MIKIPMLWNCKVSPMEAVLVAGPWPAYTRLSGGGGAPGGEGLALDVVTKF